jgi:hypothetical protein
MRPHGIRPGIRHLVRLALRRPERAGAEMDEEIGLHLELRAEQLVARGLSPAAARAEAERRFGPLDEARRRLHTSARRREAHMQVGERLDGVRQDLRYAWRGLRRAPGFAAVVVATLALGIGATTAVFSVVNGVLLRPLPYPDAERVTAIYSRFPGLGIERGNLSEPEFMDVAALPAFERVAITGHGDVTVTGAGEPERARALSTRRPPSSRSSARLRSWGARSRRPRTGRGGTAWRC